MENKILFLNRLWTWVLSFCFGLFLCNRLLFRSFWQITNACLFLMYRLNHQNFRLVVDLAAARVEVAPTTIVDRATSVCKVTLQWLAHYLWNIYHICRAENTELCSSFDDLLVQRRRQDYIHIFWSFKKRVPICLSDVFSK